MNLLKRVAVVIGFTDGEFKITLLLATLFFMSFFSEDLLVFFNNLNNNEKTNYNDSLYQNLSLSNINISKNYHYNVDIKQESFDFSRYKININSADLNLLDKLPGIGIKTAEKIIKFREEKGSFKKIDDITKVSGIGKKKFEKLKNYIFVE